ncbi:hypothetical protein BGZ51_008570 [Haplosporangium sp. Z 767]|nr:hypothetical protein BGZ51_008570 [Haplosporangium sp. Z 767]
MSLSQETTPTAQPTITSSPATPTPPSTTAAASEATTATELYKSFHSQIENLKRLPVPYSDIYHALSSYDTFPLKTLHERFSSAATSLTTWLENAEMAVFALGMDVGQGGASDKRDVGEMDIIMNRFQPNVDMLVELQEKVESRLKAATYAEQEEASAQKMDQDLKQTIQNIQSSWTSLKQMLEKVKGDLAGARLRAELITHMDSVLADIGDICASIDAYNNERSAMTSDEEGLLPGKSASSQVDAQAKQRSLETLAQVDSRIELLISRIDFLDNRVGSLPKDEASLGSDSEDALQSRYQQVLCRWDDLKFRRERVSEELKEDKWLEVFDQVAEQVESMMESMERAVVHCQGLLDQVKHMVRQKVVPDAPIDREHLYSIFKSFEAKYKYYAPAVNKMLDMLENGIESRMTRNHDVISRHQAMNLKWDQLQDCLERVDMELDGVERMLDILDESRTPYLPKLPLKKTETPNNAARRPVNTKPGWKSPTPQSPLQQRQQQRQQQHASPAQRGRNPPPSSFRSPSPTRGRAATRAPADDYAQYRRPWSPANSNSSLSQSGVFSSNGFYRSLSPSPTRSPTRGMYRLRPWCPSVSVSSPGIPGIPQPPSQASTFIPRPVSSAGQNRVETPAPTGRASSSMSGGSRSAASTPSTSRASGQYKPVFSPAGSMSKLSNGVRSTVASPSPSSAPAGPRKTHLPMPSSVPSATSRTMSQRSALSPSPQMQRPKSHGYGREVTSPVPTNYAATSSRQRQFGSNGVQTQTRSGFGAQEGRAPPASLRVASRQSQHGYFDERTQYSSRPGSAAGSNSSVGRDAYHYASYDEPTSPSASSSSSITSSNRQQQYLQQQRHYDRDQDLPELMDKIQIEDVQEYVPTRGDELDEEFAKVVNRSPVQMQIRRLGEGKYYFGGRIDEQTGKPTRMGGKMVLCRLMEYGRVGSGEDDSGVSSGGSHSGTDDGLYSSSKSQMARRTNSGGLAALRAEEATQREGKKRPRKVLVRVGGGWQDLDIFMLDHSSLAPDSVALRGY